MEPSNKPKIASTNRAKHRPPRSTGSQPVTVETYESDPLFPDIARAVASILATGKVVAPTEVLVRMRLLDPQDIEAWRFGRISYLERAIDGDPEHLGRLLKILTLHCHDQNLVATPTVYMSAGKPPLVPLRFTKNREQALEKIYAKHFVWPGKIPFHPPHREPSVDDLLED